jgi:outer membrane protein OmpA-like peptidoglycan-associated protein
MAYVHATDDSFPLESPGCGPNCPCGSGKQASARLGEWYVRENADTPEPARMAGWAVPVATLGIGSRLGSYLAEPTRRQTVVTAPVVIRVQPFLVLDHFQFDKASLSPFHTSLVARAAQHVVSSWQVGSQPTRTIRLVGHTDGIGSDLYNMGLGQQRALEVQKELVQVIEQLRPGLSSQINIVPQTLGKRTPRASNRTPEGRARNRRVEVYLSAVVPSAVPPAPPPSQIQPPPPPPSRPIRIPTPEEAARSVTPLAPETPEERIRRILTMPSPTLPPRRSFSELFWKRVDDELNSTMSRVGVPRSLRGPIREAAHAAIQQGAETILNNSLDQTSLASEGKAAIRAVVRAAAQTPVR